MADLREQEEQERLRLQAYYARLFEEEREQEREQNAQQHERGMGMEL